MVVKSKKTMGLIAIVIASALIIPCSRAGYSQNRINDDTSLPTQKASRAKAISDTKLHLESLLREHGGWEKVRTRVGLLRESVLEGREPDQGGKSAFSFFSFKNYEFNLTFTRVSLLDRWQGKTKFQNYQKEHRDAVGVIVAVDRELKKRGISLLLVPIPSKIEAYASLFDPKIPETFPVSPARLSFILELLEQDVEVLDILPDLLQLKTTGDEIPVYQRERHHVSGLGMRRAGDLVAQRLARYSIPGCDPGRFSDKKRMSKERGRNSTPMWVWEVLYDQEPYTHVSDSPIVTIGDSQSHAYRTASLASHIARATGLKVTDLSQAAGGSFAHHRFIKKGMGPNMTRAVVIWIFSSAYAELGKWQNSKWPE